MINSINATLIRGFGNRPSLGLQCLAQVLKTLLVDLEIRISDPRRTTDLYDSILDFQLEIINKGFATVQEFGKVTKPTLVFDRGRAGTRQVFADNRPASLVGIILTFLKLWRKA